MNRQVITRSANNSSDNRPTLAIITATLNAAKSLRKAFESIEKQTRLPDEYIVVDGGSTDDTKALLKEYEVLITGSISEPDTGISDAMNKGVRLASSDYIWFVHADDQIVAPDRVALVLRYIAKGSDIYAFDIVYGSGSGERVASSQKWLLLNQMRNGFRHQGVVCKRALFRHVGLFDTTLSVTMDYDFFIRAIAKGASLEVIHGFPIVRMGAGGVSSNRDWAHVERRLEEEKRVHFRYAEAYWQRLFYRIFWKLYPRYKLLRYRIERIGGGRPRR